jgi:hypothetical protein
MPITMCRQLIRLIALLTIATGFAVGPVRADAPVAAAAGVHRLMAALRANDRDAYLDALADDYQYNALTKADLDPFGFSWILSDRLLYRIVQLSLLSPDTAVALVDTDFTGRLNLEAIGSGSPAIVGSNRLWLELRRQPDGQWRISGIRPVRMQFRHSDTPFTFVRDVTVNGRSSVQAEPGASLRVEGRTLLALQQALGLGASQKTLPLNLEANARAFESWSTEVIAPSEPGRYYLDAFSLIFVPRTDGGLFLAWDQMTVPVIVR